MPRPNQTHPGETEFRFALTDLRVETRTEGGPRKLVGHASVFDQWATLYAGKYWTWREIVRPGAFRNALAEQQDVRALINHDANLVLGRTTSGTVKLSEDAAGLLAEIDPPDTQAARDLMILMERRDISGMSIGFKVRPSGDRTTITTQGDMEFEDREILDVDLFDVSIVTYPAFPQTDVAVRSMAEIRDHPRLRKTARRDHASRRQRLVEAE